MKEANPFPNGGNGRSQLIGIGPSETRRAWRDKCSRRPGEGGGGERGRSPSAEPDSPSPVIDLATDPSCFYLLPLTLVKHFKVTRENHFFLFSIAFRFRLNGSISFSFLFRMERALLFLPLLSSAELLQGAPIAVRQLTDQAVISVQ